MDTAEVPIMEAKKKGVAALSARYENENHSDPWLVGYQFS